jgi:hypothetical protein
MTWEGLSRTSDEGVRHCSGCGRDVFLTETEEDLDANAELGRCVAVASAGRMFVGEVNSPGLASLSLPALYSELLHEPD